MDPTTKAGQQLLGRYVTPAEIRRAGRRRLAEHILRAGRIARRHADALADKALAAAREQTITVPGERVAADLVRELAVEAAAHPQPAVRRWTTTSRPRSRATLTRPSSSSLPGMGATLAAEFIAEAGSIDRFPHRRQARRRRWPGTGAQAVGQGPLPQTRPRRQPDAQARLLPIRLLLGAPPPPPRPRPPEPPESRPAGWSCPPAPPRSPRARRGRRARPAARPARRSRRSPAGRRRSRGSRCSSPPTARRSTAIPGTWPAARKTIGITDDIPAPRHAKPTSAAAGADSDERACRTRRPRRGRRCARAARCRSGSRAGRRRSARASSSPRTP